MELTKCYHKNPSMLARRVDDGVILVPMKRNVADLLQCVYTLNALGAHVWELLDREATVTDIASTIAEEWKVELPQAEAEVVSFLAQLESIGAITPA